MPSALLSSLLFCPSSSSHLFLPSPSVCAASPAHRSSRHRHPLLLLPTILFILLAAILVPTADGGTSPPQASTPNSNSNSNPASLLLSSSTFPFATSSSISFQLTAGNNNNNNPNTANGAKPCRCVSPKQPRGVNNPMSAFTDSTDSSTTANSVPQQTSVITVTSSTSTSIFFTSPTSASVVPATTVPSAPAASAPVKRVKLPKGFTIGIYRIIGNNVPFVHGPSQNIHSTEYIINNEVPVPGVRMRFVINRIMNRTIEARLISTLLKKFPQSDILRIPFRSDVVENIIRISSKLPEKDCYKAFNRTDNTDSKSAKEHMNELMLALRKANKTQLYTPKQTVEGALAQKLNAYITNQNPARNLAIKDAEEAGFDCAYPFDGNIFIPEETMQHLIESCLRAKAQDAIFVPMIRMVRRGNELCPAEERAEEQIGFRKPFTLLYNEDDCFNYGHKNKVELLERAARLCGGDCVRADQEVWRLPNQAGSMDKFIAANPTTRKLLRIFGMQRLLDIAIKMATPKPKPTMTTSSNKVRMVPLSASSGSLRRHHHHHHQHKRDR